MTNVCIVGFGSIAPVHISAVNNCKNAKLYGICDIDVSKKQTCETEYGAKFYSDFDEMLKDEKIDAVHICTPHYLHFEMTEKALKAGKKVVCEKPAVMTSDELKKLKTLGQKHGILAAGYAYADLVTGREKLILLYRTDKSAPDTL